MFRQSVFGRLAGYEDVTDAGRLARYPVMRAITGRKGFDRPAASESQMGRFETGTLLSSKNLTALANFNGKWVDRVQRLPKSPNLILDIDSSHGEQECSAHNGPVVAAIIRCSSSVNTVIWKAARCAPATFTVRTTGRPSLTLSFSVTIGLACGAVICVAMPPSLFRSCSTIWKPMTSVMPSG